MNPDECRKELKPCAHCGCSNKDRDEGQPMVELDNENVTGRWYVVCHGCGARSGLYQEQEKALDNWDSRTESKPVTREEIGIAGVQAWIETYRSLDGNEVSALGKAFDAIYALQLSAPQSPVVPDTDPPVQHKREIRFIDATPDKGLPFRILNAYKESGIFTDNTLGLDPQSEICIRMNEWQCQRNDIIDEAIHRLATGGRESREQPGEWDELTKKEMWDLIQRIRKITKDDGTFGNPDRLVQCMAEELTRLGYKGPYWDDAPAESREDRYREADGYIKAARERVRSIRGALIELRERAPKKEREWYQMFVKAGDEAMEWIDKALATTQPNGGGSGNG